MAGRGGRLSGARALSACLAARVVSSFVPLPFKIASGIASWFPLNRVDLCVLHVVTRMYTHLPRVPHSVILRSPLHELDIQCPARNFNRST